jgi:hypothetical protein
MNSGSAAGTEETTRYCNASAAAFPAFPSALTCSLHFGLSDLIAGVYTPNVANEARFGSTLLGMTTASTANTATATQCRSGIPELSGMLTRIEAGFGALAERMARAAVYASDVMGRPSALLGQSSVVALTNVVGTQPFPVYTFPVAIPLVAHTRYWLCVRTDAGAFVGSDPLSGEGATDTTQGSATFASGFNANFSVNVFPTDRDYTIAGIYTPENVPGTGRALVIGGGVF